MKTLTCRVVRIESWTQFPSLLPQWRFTFQCMDSCGVDIRDRYGFFEEWYVDVFKRPWGTPDLYLKSAVAQLRRALTKEETPTIVVTS